MWTRVEGFEITRQRGKKKRKMKRPGAIFPPVPDERSRSPSLAARPSKSLSSLFFFFFKLKINNFKIYLHLSQAVRIFPENLFGMKWGNFNASPTGGTCVGNMAKIRFRTHWTQVPPVGLMSHQVPPVGLGLKFSLFKENLKIWFDFFVVFLWWANGLRGSSRVDRSSGQRALDAGIFLFFFFLVPLLPTFHPSLLRALIRFVTVDDFLRWKILGTLSDPWNILTNISGQMFGLFGVRVSVWAAGWEAYFAYWFIHRPQTSRYNIIIPRVCVCQQVNDDRFGPLIRYYDIIL